MSPFDFVNAINTSKKDLIRQSDNPELSEKLYNPFIINKALSYFPDTILYANELNINNSVDKLLQNDYFLNTIRQGKRFAKWHKHDSSDAVEVIQEYYKVNHNKAEEIAKVLTADQIDLIRTKIIKGGITNELSKHTRRGEAKEL